MLNLFRAHSVATVAWVFAVLSTQNIFRGGRLVRNEQKVCKRRSRCVYRANDAGRWQIRERWLKQKCCENHVRSPRIRVRYIFASLICF